MREFLDIFKKREPKELIKNCDVNIDEIEVGGHLFPVTVNKSYYANSYTTSFYSANISYAKDELHLVDDKRVEFIAGALLSAVGLVFKLFWCDKMAILNNWTFSTNFHPELSAQEVSEMTDEMTKRYGGHYIAMRSVNSTTDSVLIESLKANGWLLLPARSVYLFFKEDGEIFKHNHTKKDQKLLRETPLELIEPSSLQPSDFGRIKELFDKLFIEKHSHLNPDFSVEFLQALHQKKIVEFFAFREKDSGAIVAFIGFFVAENIISTPILGYDTSLPQEMGLYRLLMALLLKTAKDRELTLNLSSGAGSFKRGRGGKATLEYTAIYANHLSKPKRFFMQTLSKILNRYLPKAFEKYKI